MIEADGMSVERADEQVLGEPLIRSSEEIERELDAVIGLLGGASGETIDHRIIVVHERIERMLKLRNERLDAIERENIAHARELRGEE